MASIGSLENADVIMDVVWLDSPLAQDRMRVGIKAATLARLLQAGISVPNGFCIPLEVAGQIVNNVVFDRIVDEVRKNGRAGGNLEAPISANDIFPDMVIQMIAMGEEAGRLGESLEKSASYLERELDATVKRLITILEPALTIIVAAMVGLFAMAIYLPMFDVIKGMSGS